MDYHFEHFSKPDKRCIIVPQVMERHDNVGLRQSGQIGIFFPHKGYLRIGERFETAAEPALDLSRALRKGTEEAEVAGEIGDDKIGLSVDRTFEDYSFSSAQQTT